MEAVRKEPQKKARKKVKPSEPIGRLDDTLHSPDHCEATEKECDDPQIKIETININVINGNSSSSDVAVVDQASNIAEIDAQHENNLVEQQIHKEETNKSIPVTKNQTISVALSPDKLEKDHSSNFDKFLDINKQILHTLENIDCISAYPANKAPKEAANDSHIETKEAEDFTIKPYTEQQLDALYYNSELDVLEDFTNNYLEAELKSLHVKQHVLYDLLTNYLKLREKIIGNKIEIEQLRQEYRNLSLELWTTDTATVTGSAACQDGKIVSASHEYERSIFHRSTFQSVTRILNNLQKLIYENHALFSYSAEDFRLQIELYIENIIENVLTVLPLNKRSPVSLTIKDESIVMNSYVNEVRASISVLFAFQRKVIKDPKFIEDVQGWLTQLVALLIRIANYQDHLFLMHHILRCPAGVGTWAAAFIQVPLDVRIDEPFGNYQINHLLTILTVILSPVRFRKEFLKDIAHSHGLSSEANWVLVDSDGEEDEETDISLRENDLVAIFNQLPLGDMFRCVLLINRTDNKDQYDLNLITDQHVLRFFAFSSLLLKLLRRGLETYCQPKYNQFSKRLSRFIRHVVQYATDQWELFLKSENMFDKAMEQRLQTEYDAFFLRAIYYLYSSQKLRAWQFLAVVPYNMVTIRTLWKIYYFLHMPDEKAENIINFSVSGEFEKMIWDKELREQFEDKLSNLEAGEIYYLLNIFANMALARSEADGDFIYTSAMDILQVGFISQTTQDTCSKTARVLLVHLTSKYPYLLSHILKAVQENLDKIGSLALYLYEDIPLSIWVLSDYDLTIIQSLLLNHPIDTTQTKLARMILSRLNWDRIPYEKHCDTAVIVLKAVHQEPMYLHWGWQTILRLRLHISDRHFQELGRVQELERCEILLKGIRENQPLSSFVAVLMTTWGHLVPLICSKGLNQLIILQTHQKYEAALFALYQIMPIFINCQECIINCDKFQELLVNLLNADKGYISYAKSFITTQTTVLQQFGNMLETQLTNYASYNQQSPRLLVRLWMNSLVSIPNWNKDKAILYLLDVIIRASFLYQDSLQLIYQNFRDLYQSITPQESGSIISMFKWASGNTSPAYSLLSNSLGQYPWLAYVFLEVEHQERDLKTGLWMEVLKELSQQKGKINVDNAIKTAAANLKLTAFSSSGLCIYRWAQQALDVSVGHPIVPLLWQKFFILYLTRLPYASQTGKTCVGERFFDGMVNFAFLKRVKRKLQESVEFYKGKMDNNSEDELDMNEQLLCKSRYDVFQAFLLWLEEPRLQSGNLLLHSLPNQYEPKLLALIIQEGSQVPWYEYIDNIQISNDQALAIKLWRVANFREKSHFNQPLPNPGHGVESADPVERILRRLASYDNVKLPPELSRKNVIIPKINFTNKQEMFSSLKPCLETLNRMAHNHNLNSAEQKALNCSYQELVPQLFTCILRKIQKKVPCKGKNQTVLCSGPAIITLEIREVKRNGRIDHEIDANRQSYELLLEKSLQSPASSLCNASVAIQHCVRHLQHQLKTNPGTSELGVELFYHILTLLQDEIVTYLPAKTLFAKCIEKLGQSHICGVEYETPRLLQWILKEPNLGGYLVPHFSPSNCGSSNMLLMYSTITKETSKKYHLIFALTSKFEVGKWLTEKIPNLSQRSQFIGNIIEALCSLGFDPPIDTLVLHELYRKHLIAVFEFQFPEHYGEIILSLLKVSNGSLESNLIAESVWIDILNSLAKPTKMDPKAPLRGQLRQYSQHQKVLSHQDLLETANLLARHFTQERLSYGLYGLYPKCRNYLDVFVLSLGMTGHGLILSMLNTHQGLLGPKLCEKIWPYIREMFAPWLVPYSMHNLKEDMASWIQQLADDRSILLPWIPSDQELADKMINSFCECIIFVLDTIPASFNILSYLWQWYGTSFGHTSVKSHILTPIHRAFTTLPWNDFWPSVVDLEFMLRIIDQYLPECHSFLGHVFVSVPWMTWINSFAEAPLDIKIKVYHCFLTLLVKLSIEPNIRKNHLEKARSILIQAENLDWTIVDAIIFQHIMDWVVMSCNSAVILKSDPLDMDVRMLCLLKLVSGYDKELIYGTSDKITKRHIYVKSHIKLLSIYISRTRNVQNIGEKAISSILNSYLNSLDTVVKTTEEMEVLLKEIISIMQFTDISEIAVKVFTKWIDNKTYGLAIKALLKNLCSSVNDYKYLAVLYEATLTSYFNNNVIETSSEEPTWRKASELIHICASKPIEFEQALIEEGAVLTLNAILLQRVRRNVDKENLLNYCINCMDKLKVRESIEPKVPLIWFSIINLALQHSIKDESTCRVLLWKFSHILLRISEEAGSSKWGRGLLNVIGLSKSEAVSINFRFICRAMGGYILAQLPEKIRTAANAPCGVGMPGGNTECPKILLELDFRQSQGKIKECAEIALSKIQDPANSLHNANAFLWTLLKQFYVKPYIKDVDY